MSVVRFHIALTLFTPSEQEVRWLEDKASGEFKGCGFVEFSDVSWIDEAAKKNGEMLLGRPVRIDYN